MFAKPVAPVPKRRDRPPRGKKPVVARQEGTISDGVPATTQGRGKGRTVTGNSAAEAVLETGSGLESTETHSVDLDSSVGGRFRRRRKGGRTGSESDSESVDLDSSVAGRVRQRQRRAPRSDPSLDDSVLRRSTRKRRAPAFSPYYVTSQKKPSKPPARLNRSTYPPVDLNSSIVTRSAWKRGGRPARGPDLDSSIVTRGARKREALRRTPPRETRGVSSGPGSPVFPAAQRLELGVEMPTSARTAPAADSITSAAANKTAAPANTMAATGNTTAVTAKTSSAAASGVTQTAGSTAVPASATAAPEANSSLAGVAATPLSARKGGTARRDRGVRKTAGQTRQRTAQEVTTAAADTEPEPPAAPAPAPVAEAAPTPALAPTQSQAQAAPEASSAAPVPAAAPFPVPAAVPFQAPAAVPFQAPAAVPFQTPGAVPFQAPAAVPFPAQFGVPAAAVGVTQPPGEQPGADGKCSEVIGISWG